MVIESSSLRLCPYWCVLTLGTSCYDSFPCPICQEYDVLFDQGPDCLTRTFLSLPALEEQCQAMLNLQLPEWSWLVYISVPLSVLPPFLRTSLFLSPRTILFLQQILLWFPPWNLQFLSHLLISALFMFLHNLFTCHFPMPYSGLLWESVIVYSQPLAQCDT